MAVMFLPLCLSLFLVPFSECVPVGDRDFALNFLLKYQYVSPGRSSGADVTQGIKNFQQFFRLPVSGNLDKLTMDLMKKPRCGNKDLVRVSFSGKQKRYVTAPPWSKTHLTYTFVNHGEDIHQDKVEEIIAEAFTFWSDVSGLSFSKVSGSADINILFGRYHHGDPYAFDGPGGTLAHAFFPSDGRVHFDEDETYTHESPQGTNLLWVAVHELGHALGLHHTNIYGAVMYPYYQGYKPDMQLHTDDVQGIQSLYPPTGPVTTRPTPEATTHEVTEATTHEVTTPIYPVSTQKVCKDLIGHCKDLYEANYCNLYPDNLRYYCPKTCGYCPITRPTPEATTQEVTEATTHEVTEATTQEVTEATTHEVTEATTQEVTEATTHEVTEPTTHEVTEPTTHEVTEPTTQEVTTPIYPESTQKVCKDLIGHCKDLYEANYCNLYPDNLRYYCPKTCGYCR